MKLFYIIREYNDWEDSREWAIFVLASTKEQAIKIFKKYLKKQFRTYRVWDGQSGTNKRVRFITFLKNTTDYYDEKNWEEFVREKQIKYGTIYDLQDKEGLGNDN